MVPRYRRGGRPKQTHCSKCGQPYTKYYRDNRHGVTGFCRPCWRKYYANRHWYAYSVRFKKSSLPYLKEAMAVRRSKNLNDLILAALQQFDRRIR